MNSLLLILSLLACDEINVDNLTAAQKHQTANKAVDNKHKKMLHRILAYIASAPEEDVCTGSLYVGTKEETDYLMSALSAKGFSFIRISDTELNICWWEDK